MYTKPPIRLIKRETREAPQLQVKIGSTSDPNRWSTAVRSWVSEFQQQRDELPAFDSLFKDAPAVISLPRM